MTTTPAKEPEFEFVPKSASEVAKAIVYIALTAGSLIVAAQQSSASHAVDLNHALSIGIQVLALIPLWLFAGTLVKTLIAAASAVASTLIQLFVGGYHPLTFADYISLAIAASAVFGVAIVPNKKSVALAA